MFGRNCHGFSSQVSYFYILFWAMFIKLAQIRRQLFQKFYLGNYTTDFGVRGLRQKMLYDRLITIFTSKVLFEDEIVLR